MHYIAIFVIYCNDAIVSAIETAYTTVQAEDGTNAEEMIDQLFTKALLGAGLTADAAMIIYIGIVFQTIFYLIAYINRVLKVGFLIVISPLITVTYSIDKMGDGKAQALDTWLKEYIYTILIQPFHCIIYFSFISIAFKLVCKDGWDFSFNQLSAGVLAILCIKFINDGEKIVRKIFGFQDDNSKTSMMAGAMMAVATVKSASRAASNVRTGFRKSAAFAGKMKKDFIKDAPKLDKILGGNENGRFSKIADGITAMDNKFGEWGKTIGNFKPVKTITGVKNNFGNFRRNNKFGRVADFAARKSMTASAAIMAFAATYATGDTDMLSAIGYGSGFASGVDKSFELSSARNDADAGASYAEAIEAKREAMESDVKTLEGNIEKHEQALDNFDEVQQKVKELEHMTPLSEEDIKENEKDQQKADDFTAAADKAEEKMRQEEEAAAKALEKKKAGNLSKRERTKLQEEADAHAKEAAKQKQIAEQSRTAAKNAQARIKARGGDSEALKQQIDELDPDGYIRSFETKDKLRESLFKEKQELQAMKKQLDDFYNEENINGLIAAMKNTVTDKEIKSKANEIERLVQEIVAARHLLASTDGMDVNNDIATEEDMEIGSMISSKLISSIDRDFIKHSDLSSMELIRNAGLGGFDTEQGSGQVEKDVNPYIQNLMNQLNSAVAEQKYNYRVRGISQAEEINAAMGRSQDAFNSGSASRARTQIERNARKHAEKN